MPNYLLKSNFSWMNLNFPWNSSTFSCFKNFWRLRRRQLVFLSDFCTKFWSFWTSRSPPPNFWQVTPPIEALMNIYIRTRYWGSDRPKGGVIKIEKWPAFRRRKRRKFWKVAHFCQKLVYFWHFPLQEKFSLKIP